jgi:hypothetical protein
MKDLNIEQVEPIKLSFTDPIYYTKPNASGTTTVYCKLQFVVKGPNDVLNAINLFADEDCYESIGQATVDPRDDYDFVTGKRIARAKAESLAYKKASKLFARICGHLTSVALSFMQFNDKAEYVVDHNDTYLSKF